MRDEDIAMSVACIEMIESLASGVMYSRDPSNPLEDNVLINAVWGLGPYAVDGVIIPDTYIVAKDEDLSIRKRGYLINRFSLWPPPVRAWTRLLYPSTNRIRPASPTNR